MPGFDRTGPFGNGPMTGRGFGPCGRGMGRGMGRGRGFRRFAPAQAYEYTKEDEAADLKMEKELAERDLKAINDRLKELGKK